MKLRTIFLTVVFAILVFGGMTPAFSQEGAPAQPPAVKADATPDSFTIARFVVAKDVQDREPVDITDVFPASTVKAYCFLEARDVTQDTDVEFVWFLGDNQMWSSAMSIKQGPRWRTYANKTISGLRGDWRVEVRDANGKTLKSVAFKVE